MIRPARPADRGRVARHYDELDPFYRALWGEHLHHGLWTTGCETPEAAVLALVDEVARRAGIPAVAPDGRPLELCDVGSGYGAVARRLAERGARVTALTVSEAQYRHATNAASGPAVGRAPPRFLLRDWMENGLPDGSFDAVIAIESLSHMDDPGRAIAEAFRVLRPGGRFVACVWLAAQAPSPWQVRRLLRPVCDEGRLPGLPAPSDYGRWLAAAGFEDPVFDDVSHRVARTWDIVARRVVRAALDPASWAYLLDGRNTERAFALSVLRLLVAYRTGAMRYAIVSGRRIASGRPSSYR